MKINKRLLFICIAIPNFIGAITGLLTKDSMESFSKLNQPPLSPPGWIFPVVWIILYTLMGISSYLILTSDAKESEKQRAMKLYGYQLAVNFLWPTFFFNLGWYLFSFFWLLLLLILVIAMIRSFSQISKLAAYLNIPYLIWLLFAGYLNFTIWWLN